MCVDDYGGNVRVVNSITCFVVVVCVYTDHNRAKYHTVRNACDGDVAMASFLVVCTLNTTGHQQHAYDDLSSAYQEHLRTFYTRARFTLSGRAQTFVLCIYIFIYVCFYSMCQSGTYCFR